MKKLFLALLFCVQVFCAPMPEPVLDTCTDYASSMVCAQPEAGQLAKIESIDLASGTTTCLIYEEGKVEIIGRSQKVNKACAKKFEQESQIDPADIAKINAFKQQNLDIAKATARRSGELDDQYQNTISNTHYLVALVTHDPALTSKEKNMTAEMLATKTSAQLAGTVEQGMTLWGKISDYLNEFAGYIFGVVCIYVFIIHGGKLGLTAIFNGKEAGSAELGNMAQQFFAGFAILIMFSVVPEGGSDTLAEGFSRDAIYYGQGVADRVGHHIAASTTERELTRNAQAASDLVEKLYKYRAEVITKDTQNSRLLATCDAVYPRGMLNGVADGTEASYRIYGTSTSSNLSVTACQQAIADADAFKNQLAELDYTVKAFEVGTSSQGAKLQKLQTATDIVLTASYGNGFLSSATLPATSIYTSLANADSSQNTQNSGSNYSKNGDDMLGVAATISGMAVYTMMPGFDSLRNSFRNILCGAQGILSKLSGAISRVASLAKGVGQVVGKVFGAVEKILGGDCLQDPKVNILATVLAANFYKTAMQYLPLAVFTVVGVTVFLFWFVELFWYFFALKFIFVIAFMEDSRDRITKFLGQGIYLAIKPVILVTSVYLCIWVYNEIFNLLDSSIFNQLHMIAQSARSKLDGSGGFSLSSDTFNYFQEILNIGLWSGLLQLGVTIISTAAGAKIIISSPDLVAEKLGFDNFRSATSSLAEGAVTKTFNPQGGF